MVFDPLLPTDFVTASPGQPYALARIGYAIDAGVPPGAAGGLAFDPLLTSVTLFNGSALTSATAGRLAADDAGADDPPPVPEPATAAVLLAAAGLAAARRRSARPPGVPNGRPA